MRWEAFNLAHVQPHFLAAAEGWASSNQSISAKAGAILVRRRIMMTKKMTFAAAVTLGATLVATAGAA
jgi:hypothetical protein